MGGLVKELRERIDSEIDLRPGYTVIFGGQFENQQRAQEKLMIVVPLSLGLIFYCSTLPSIPWDRRLLL